MEKGTLSAKHCQFATSGLHNYCSISAPPIPKLCVHHVASKKIDLSPVKICSLAYSL